MPGPTTNPPLTPRRRSNSHAQTPRKHKPASNAAKTGLKQLKETVAQIKTRVKRKLKLNFEMDEWQAQIIHRVRQGYDSILIAGTGYGKSLVFHGLASLDTQKIVVVIAPLKALERDQVNEAESRGLAAAMVNEDTSCPALWADIRHAKHQLYFISPEMALGDSFLSLWQDRAFRSKVQAVIIDEAHCVAEWGDDFRKDYSGLSKLRNYTGQETPFLACTATCSSAIFDTLWSSLSFGFRPFWGLDVGVDRGNLSFITRVLENTKNPALDAMNLLPSPIPDDPTDPPTVLDKCIFYFDTVEACNLAVQSIRKLLPEHLRPLVQSFTSVGSEEGKAALWDAFRAGEVRILCATDAAGMGCNVPDVKYVVLFSAPRTVSTLIQRWGRAGRDREIEATCLLFVESWAFRPQGVPQVTKTGKIKPLEAKTITLKRAALDLGLEELINLGFDANSPSCIHSYLRQHFRPDTQLDTYTGFVNQDEVFPEKNGVRSRKSMFEATWTRLDLTDRRAPSSRCCGFCNPSLARMYAAPKSDDKRLSKYARDFIYPLAAIPRPLNLSTSTLMPTTTSSNLDTPSSNTSLPTFVPLKAKDVVVDPSEISKLRQALEDWRTAAKEKRSEFNFLSRRIDLPDEQLNRLVTHAGEFMKEKEVTADLVDQTAVWDMASTDDLEEVAALISSWRITARSKAVPASGRGKKKKARTENDNSHAEIPTIIVPESRSRTSNLSTAPVDPDRTPRASPSRPTRPLPQPSFSPARMGICRLPDSHTPTESGTSADSSSDPFLSTQPNTAPSHYRHYPSSANSHSANSASTATTSGTGLSHYRAQTYYR